MQNYQTERRKLTSEIRRIIRPHLKPSGYGDSTEKDGKLRLAMFEGFKAHNLRKGYVLKTYEGFTRSGVIEDSYGGGMVTVNFSEYPIEDLFRLLHSLKTRPPKWRK